MSLSVGWHVPVGRTSGMSLSDGTSGMSLSDGTSGMSMSVGTSESYLRAMSQGSLSEWLPKKGQVYQEDLPSVVLCKPKILPLKSVTLEKMEKMQKDAQEQVKEQEKKDKLMTDQGL
jgi:BBSome-interacting protein 1